jgi:hypothetical protein
VLTKSAGEIACLLRKVGFASYRAYYGELDKAKLEV